MLTKIKGPGVEPLEGVKHVESQIPRCAEWDGNIYQAMSLVQNGHMNKGKWRLVNIPYMEHLGMDMFFLSMKTGIFTSTFSLKISKNHAFI